MGQILYTWTCKTQTVETTLTLRHIWIRVSDPEHHTYEYIGGIECTYVHLLLALYYLVLSSIALALLVSFQR